MTPPKLGLWLIGARGGIASTVQVGLALLSRGRIPPTGLVTSLPPFCNLPIPDWSQFVVGGHEIRSVALVDEARRLAVESRAFPTEFVAEAQPDLEDADARIRVGTLVGVGETIEQLAGESVPRGESPRQAIARLRADLADFQAKNALEHVIVVNVASTEPTFDASALPKTWPELESQPNLALPASSLYAIAALDLGFSYLNFTPSLGSSPVAIDDLARLRKTRHMGCDGKTGETLLKSVLAPMFRRRNLNVLSWVGHNIFGNLDGRVLDNPVNKKSKVASKSHLLEQTLGYAPQSHVSIEYIESLGDWKTAWDHVHFEGFLGTRMILQFIWQGCDSLLAAPLALDLVRLTEAARQRGHVGLMTFLASFFKSPYGVAEAAFDRQFFDLENWANGS